MRCAWDELIGIIPARMRQETENLGRYSLRELRLRQGAPPELVLDRESKWLSCRCCREDISFVLQAASRYSPWAMESAARGFLTAPGGHRIGLCGLALYQEGRITGLREITSLCIRVARDYPGIADRIPSSGNVLILGAPGWGKTTLLRDLIRLRSERNHVGVVDERGELFPDGFSTGTRTDILRGCRKGEGLQQLLRTMGPGCIALDEITEEGDCQALIQAANCGVTLLATAHAGSREEFLSRPVYVPLANKRIFDFLVILNRDRTYSVERMTP